MTFWLYSTANLVLLNPKSSSISNVLRNGRISSSAIHVSYSPIVHFFEINDINLNTRKIKRFFPQDESDRYSTDRPYSIDEDEQILNKCDIRSRVIIFTFYGFHRNKDRRHFTSDEEGRPGIRVGDPSYLTTFGLYMISVSLHLTTSRSTLLFCILVRHKYGWLKSRKMRFTTK